MIPFRKSIGFRLFAISFILLALPLLVDSFILVQRRYENSIVDAKSYLMEVTHLRQLPLSNIRPLNESVLLLIISSLNLETKFPEKRDPELDEKLKKIAEIGNFFGVFLVKITPEGRDIVIASGREEFLGRDYTTFFELYRTLGEATAAKGGYETYISYDSDLKRPFYIASETIYSLDNKPIGIVAISDDITERIKELLTPDYHHYKVNFALLLKSGLIFAASDPRLNFNYFKPLKPEYLDLYKIDTPFTAKLIPNKPLTIKDTMGFPFFEFNWEDEEQIGYIQKMANVEFALLAYASKKDIFKSPFLSFLNLYTIYLTILIVGGTIALLLIKRMAKPIQDLSKVMIDIQKGNLAMRYHHDPLGFEINSLGHTFNKMIDNLLAQKHLAEEERINKEIFAKELRLGQQVQRTLLPQVMPQYKGVDLAEIYIPSIEVGGDFYDVFVKTSQGHSQLVLAIADASGKGVRACLYSLSLRNMIRIFAKEYDDIGQAMAKANNLFCNDTGDTGMFVTAIVGIFDEQTRKFQYVSCGHNPLMVLRKEGNIEVLNHQNIAMGVVKKENGMESRITELKESDTLILYTDGITEAHNSNNELYGEERLTLCLKRSLGLKAKEIVKNIVQDVNEFVGKAPQHDDITLLVMKIRG